MKEYLTVLEAAKKASVCCATIREWISRYKIGVKVGGRFRISPEKLREVLDGTADLRIRAKKKLERLEDKVSGAHKTDKSI